MNTYGDDHLNIAARPRRFKDIYQRIPLYSGAENVEDRLQADYIKASTGVRASEKGLGLIQRSNIVFSQVNEMGECVATWERSEKLAENVVEFYRSLWKRRLEMTYEFWSSRSTIGSHFNDRGV